MKFTGLLRPAQAHLQLLCRLRRRHVGRVVCDGPGTGRPAGRFLLHLRRRGLRRAQGIAGLGLARLRRWVQPALVVDGPGGSSRSRRRRSRSCRSSSPSSTEPKPGVLSTTSARTSPRAAAAVSGPAGATVRMTPGELLDEPVWPSQRSSGGPAWFTYTLQGEGTETWSPRFFYYGFRYVQVEAAARAGAAPRRAR